MSADTFNHTDAAGKRRSKRARVLLAARLETPNGDIECRLRDLSRKGALIECSPTPPTGTQVTFHRGSISVPARVAWSAPGRLGLEFEYMIEENDALVRLGSGKKEPVPNFSRPAFRAGLSEHERKLAAAWGVTVGINLPSGSS